MSKTSKRTPDLARTSTSTIEDKLNDIISAAKVGEIMNRTAIAQIKAIITTETTRARIDEHRVLLSLIPDDITYASEVLGPMRDRFIALQKQQPPQQEEEE